MLSPDGRRARDATQTACPLTEAQETETAALREATFWSQNDPLLKSVPDALGGP
jgi:hypothetical protein